MVQQNKKQNGFRIVTHKTPRSSVFKRFYYFVFHHNAMIIALELVLFTGIIFVLASDEQGAPSVDPIYNTLGMNSATTTPIYGSIVGEISEPQAEKAKSNQPPDLDLYKNNEKIQKEYDKSAEIRAKYKLRGSALKRISKDDPRDRIEVAVGDEATDSEFIPKTNIARWDDEVSMTLIPKGLEGLTEEDKNLAFNGDKIKFSTPKIDYEFYEYTEGEGGYKIIWYLKERPANNKVEFTIQSKGLVFYYQPPFNQLYKNGWSDEYQREIIVSPMEVKDLDGNILLYHTQEDIVGSYAVYTAEQKINREGGKLYRSGKFGHIYRPKLSDAAGNRTLGNLYIDAEKGIYEVEIPKDFLDKAVYPIRSNDTFGYTTQGGSNQSNSVAGRITTKGDMYTGVDGTGNSMSIYSQSSASVNFYLGLYANTTFVANTNETVLSGVNQPAWRTANFATGVSLSSANSYYLFYQESVLSAFGVAFDLTAVSNWKYKNDTYGNFPSPITWSSSSTKREYSIYVTYTPSYQPRPPAINSSGGGFLTF